MNFFDKLSYGFYWFEVCVKEWYDAVIIGYYDEDEQPSWDFFCHINCNYPLTYRMTTSEVRMSDKVGHEFWVIMLKRRDGEVYADLHKTNMKIYLEYEDAEKELNSWEMCKEYVHIVKLIATLDGEE
jgi:hypothetical protein